MIWLVKLIQGRYIYLIISAVSLLLAAYITTQNSTIKSLKGQNVTLTTALQACEREKEISNEVATDYYHRLDDLTREYNAYRVRPAKCVPVHKPTDGNIPPGPGAVREVTGLRTEWLFEQAEKADKLREQMILCQDYLKGIRDAKKK